MIEGNLVGLRAIEREDLPLLKTWRNISSLRRNFREVRELNSQNQDNWFSKLNASSNDYMFIIERLQDNEPLGAGGLLYINWIIRSADFSLYIGHEDLYIDSTGYAEDAAQLLLQYGFNNLNLNKVWMELYEFDSKKISLFTEKLGFRKDGILRSNCYEDGKYWNSVIISLLKNEYRGG